MMVDLAGCPNPGDGAQENGAGKTHGALALMKKEETDTNRRGRRAHAEWSRRNCGGTATS